MSFMLCCYTICNFLHPSTASLRISIFSVQHALHTKFWHGKALALAVLGISQNMALKLGSEQEIKRERESIVQEEHQSNLLHQLIGIECFVHASLCSDSSIRCLATRLMFNHIHTAGPLKTVSLTLLTIWGPHHQKVSQPSSSVSFSEDFIFLSSVVRQSIL